MLCRVVGSGSMVGGADAAYAREMGTVTLDDARVSALDAVLREEAIVGCRGGKGCSPGWIDRC